MTTRCGGALLVVLALALAAPGAAQPAPSAPPARPLFAVSSPEPGVLLLEPVVLVGADTLVDPRPADEPQGTRLAASILSPGATYALARLGRTLGTLAVRDTTTPSCVGIAGRAAVPAGVAPGAADRAVAGPAGLVSRAAPLGAPADGAQRARLMAAARNAYRARSASAAQSDSLEALGQLALRGAAGLPRLAGGFALRTIVADSACPGCERIRTLLLILAPDGAVEHAQWRDEIEKGVTHDPWDLLDLDADGEPELLVRTVWYEAVDWAILSRRGGAWREVYRGAQTGC